MVQVELQGMHANDNGVGDERPTVRVPVGRPEQAYAHQGNLILPLRFARLLPGWQVAGAASPATPPTTATTPAPTPPAQRRTAAGRRPPPAPLWRLARRRAPASR